MSEQVQAGKGSTALPREVCVQAQENFSAYLDGVLDGRTMHSLACHLDVCTACSREFDEWRSMQSALAELGPAEAPPVLQARLRDTLAGELELGTYRSPLQRTVAFWHQSLLPAGLRFSAGLAATSLLAVGLSWVVGSVAPVQANDDRLAHLNAPRYLYSMTAPEPISTGTHFVAVMVDAKVDSRGRVYDYDLIGDPVDSMTRTRIEANLLGSIFKPATVFGVPVPGHAMMTYTAVSVRG